MGSPQHHGGVGGGVSGGAMVQPPVSEFYLCEKCDASFDSFRETQVSNFANINFECL